MILTALTFIVAFSIGYVVAVLRMEKKLALLDSLLKTNIGKMQAAILKNK